MTSRAVADAGTVTTTAKTVLLAGLGNIFIGDDGFGVAVADLLARRAWPRGVQVRDFGIRGVHLAYQLLDGYDLVVIIDAVSRGGEPGTIYVIEHAGDTASPQPAGPMLDAHDLGPDSVLELVPRLGGTLGRVVVVGCEPATVAAQLGLSPVVAASVEKAASIVAGLVRDAIGADAAIEVDEAIETSPATARDLRIGGGQRWLE